MNRSTVGMFAVLGILTLLTAVAVAVAYTKMGTP